jgi:hypothetical protein
LRPPCQTAVPKVVIFHLLVFAASCGFAADRDFR